MKNIFSTRIIINFYNVFITSTKKEVWKKFSNFFLKNWAWLPPFNSSKILRRGGSQAWYAMMTCSGQLSSCRQRCISKFFFDYFWPAKLGILAFWIEIKVPILVESESNAFIDFWDLSLLKRNVESFKGQLATLTFFLPKLSVEISNSWPDWSEKC